jgi:hypothetical protein
MRWRLFNFATAAASGVLCVAAATLWVRSHSVADQLNRSQADGYTLLSSDRGALAYVVVDESPPAGGPTAWHWARAYGGTFGGGFDSAAGSSVANWSAGGTAYRQHAWWVGHWVIVVATAIFPVVRLANGWRERRARRLRARCLRGECSACGYDLRATPDRCPECGAVPSTGQPAAA